MVIYTPIQSLFIMFGVKWVRSSQRLKAVGAYHSKEWSVRKEWSICTVRWWSFIGHSVGIWTPSNMRVSPFNILAIVSLHLSVSVTGSQSYAVMAGVRIASYYAFKLRRKLHIIPGNTSVPVVVVLHHLHELTESRARLNSQKHGAARSFISNHVVTLYWCCHSHICRPNGSVHVLYR